MTDKPIEKAAAPAQEKKPKQRKLLPLERKLRITVTPESVAALWKEIGIETTADFAARFADAKRAAKRILDDDLTRLLREVKKRG